MLSAKKPKRSFLTSDDGTETVEWSLIIAMITAGLILIVGALGLWVHGRFGDLQTDLTGETGGGSGSHGG